MTSSMSVTPYTTNDTYSNMYANKSNDAVVPYMTDDTMVDEEKSSSMAKMVGLTILGAALGATAVHFVKNGKISGLEKEATAAKAKIEEMTKQIETSKDELAEKAKDVTKLEDKVKDLEDTIKGLKGSSTGTTGATGATKKPNIFQKALAWFKNLFHKKG